MFTVYLFKNDNKAGFFHGLFKTKSEAIEYGKKSGLSFSIWTKEI